VAHAFARSLQEAGRVLQRRTMEEADVHVISERVDVSEGRVLDTGDRAAVVHQLPHVVATLPHSREPLFCERPQLIPLAAQPRVNRRVPFHRSGEPQQAVHHEDSPSVLAS
jgi:hypothetical protein